MNPTPCRDAFCALPEGPTHRAVSVVLHADRETPISIYQRVAQGRPNAFLLESVEGGERMGRYSFMGVDLDDRLELTNEGLTHHCGGSVRRLAESEPLAALSALLAEVLPAPAPELPRFRGGAVGYLGFDCMHHFEPVPLPDAPGVGLPAMRMWLVRELIAYDHRDHTITIIVHAPLDGDRAAAHGAAVARIAELVARITAPLPAEPAWWMQAVDDDTLSVVANQSDDAFRRAVRAAREAIVAGEVFQVVLSRRETIAASVSPLTLYRALRTTSPSPYMFLLHFEDAAIVGASPEVLVRLDGDELLLRPIAGTRKRGADEEEDDRLEQDLLQDAKELAEHRMLVDLGRNDLGRVAAVGSVRVEAPLHIERYSHVMHIVSDVCATLAPDRDAFDVFRACFPAGTVSGAPKIRACELLATLEPDRRGVYAGAVGYFDFAGNMDTCIAIRTMILEGGRVHLQAGAGIVYDSDPDRELEECRNKARAARVALRRALHREASLRPAPEAQPQESA
jgi:anthranilate synthase component 1